MYASALGKLLVRVCGQNGDEALKTRCLDLVDRIVELRAFGFVDVQISEIMLASARRTRRLAPSTYELIWAGLCRNRLEWPEMGTI